MLLATTALGQQQEVRFDSCTKLGAPVAVLMEDVIMRPQIAARWNAPQSADETFRKWLQPYLQKSAGGQITLSLLVAADGHCCLYRIQPNSNVRPDYYLLKKQVEEIRWVPAYQNNAPVVSTKVLQLSFSGKNLRVHELQ